MARIDLTYKRALQKIIKEGYTYEDPNRKGVLRQELSSLTIRHDLSDGFPALTTKEVYFKGALNELLFFLSGSTDIRDLWKRGVNFWDKDWGNFQGLEKPYRNQLKFHWKKGSDRLNEATFEMGRIYPYQYRNFNGRVDQIQNVLTTLRANPMSTGMVVNAWNPDDLNKMCLPPCHYGFQIVGRPLTLSERCDIYQIYIEILKEDLKESSAHELLDKYDVPRYGFEIHWQQRSTDFFLGTPINIMYYALMAQLFEKLTGHKALAVQPDLKKVHLYDNQWEVAKEQIKRDVDTYSNSYVEFADNVNYDGSIDDFLESYVDGDIQLRGYDSYEKLQVPMLAYDK